MATLADEVSKDARVFDPGLDQSLVQFHDRAAIVVRQGRRVEHAQKALAKRQCVKIMVVNVEKVPEPALMIMHGGSHEIQILFAKELGL